MNIGSRIRELRISKHISQQELGSNLFVNDKTISSWENNRTEPNLEMIIKLSEILDCSISYLVHGDTNKNNIETEIKIKLNKNEFDYLKDFLNKKAKFINESNQKDTYYQPIHRKFIEVDNITEWLRIREQGNKKILNYKKWYDTIYCDEYEVEIDNTENLDKIFKIIGLEIIAFVDKTRIKYMYMNKFEFSLDYIKELGYFVEIEIKHYDKSIMEEYDNLLKLAKNLGLNLNNIDKHGYPYYLIEK